MRALVLTVSAYLSTTSAFAFCIEPNAPGIWGSPSPPYCYDNICSQWEVDAYRRDVEAYIDRLQNFVDEAEYYAQCEADAAVDEWNDFVAEVRVRR